MSFAGCQNSSTTDKAMMICAVRGGAPQLDRIGNYTGCVFPPAK